MCFIPVFALPGCRYIWAIFILLFATIRVGFDVSALEADGPDIVCHAILTAVGRHARATSHLYAGWTPPARFNSTWLKSGEVFTLTSAGEKSGSECSCTHIHSDALTAHAHLGSTSPVLRKYHFCVLCLKTSDCNCSGRGTERAF